MDKYIGILFLIIGLAIIATVIYKLCRKRKNGIRSIYMFVFYVIVLYGTISFVKMALGEPAKDFFDSFLDMEAVTYIHYGVPLMVLMIIMPLLQGVLLREEFSSSFVMMFNSLFFFFVMPMLLIVGLVSNRYCFISVAVSAVVSFLVSMFYKGKIAYWGREKIKERFNFIFPIILLWTVTVIIYEPNQLILSNFGEFQIPYLTFFGDTISAAFLITLIYTLSSMFILSDRQFKLFGALLFGVSLAGYIQGNFLNGRMAVMDGNVQEWSMQVKLVNNVVWAVFILISVFINLHRNKKVRKVCQLISIYLCLIQTVSLAYMVASTDFSSKEEALLTSNHALEISRKNNVIVFVLDSFERQLMDGILEQSPEFNNGLADFTCYHNTSSRYAFTHQSIPYLLTNIEWERDMSDEEYIKYAFENGRWLYDISKQGYSLGIYTETQYVAKPAVDLMINYSDDIRIRLGYVKTISTMVRTSRYKMAPFAAKENYHYEAYDIENMIVNNGIWTANNDIIFHEMIDQDGLSFMKNDDYTGAFRFYHLKGAHVSFNMDEDCKDAGGNGNRFSQSKGTLKIVYEYMQEMKDLGVYDDATIIITADHGQTDATIGEQSPDPDIYDLTASPHTLCKAPK